MVYKRKTASRESPYMCLYSIYTDDENLLLYPYRMTKEEYYIYKTLDVNFKFHDCEVYLDWINSSALYHATISNIKKTNNSSTKEEITYLQSVNMNEAKKVYHAENEVLILPTPTYFSQLINTKNVDKSKIFFFKQVNKGIYHKSLFTNIVKDILKEYNLSNENSLLFLVKEKITLKPEHISKILKDKKEQKMNTQIKTTLVSDNPQNKFAFGIVNMNDDTYYFREFDSFENTLVLTKNIIKAKLFLSRTDVKDYIYDFKRKNYDVFKSIIKQSKNKNIKITKIRIENLDEIKE